MNGYGYYGDESLESLAEVLEDFGSDESDDEARRRGRRGRGSSRPGRRGGLQPRSQGGGGQYVTRAEFENAMAKTSDAIARQIAENKKQSESMKMFALLPLLQQQSSVTTNAAVAGIPANTKVLTDSADSLSKILPLLLISGMGSSSGGGLFGGGGSGSDNTMMMVAMVIALGK